MKRLANLCLPIIGKVNPCIPLPVSRPENLGNTGIPPVQDLIPSIASRMPLGSPEKAAGAFSEGVRYPPSGEGANLTSEAPRGLTIDSVKRGLNLMKEQLDTAYDWVGNNFLDVVYFLMSLSILTLAFLGLGYLGLKVSKYIYKLLRR